MKKFIINLLVLFLLFFISCKRSTVGFKPINFKSGGGIPDELIELLAVKSGNDAALIAGKTRGLGGINKTDTSDFTNYQKTYSKKYAVVIGIDDYHYWPKLENAHNDAYAMKKTLEGLGFIVYQLYDRQATRDKIQHLITDTLGKKTNSNDQVVIFFAGHGHTLKLNDGSDLGYIVPVNGRIKQYGTLISMTNLYDWSRIITARQLLFIMDCCYSGLGKLTDINVSSTYRNDNQRCQTRQIITAGQKDQQVLDEGVGSARHSLFTKHLIAALNKNILKKHKTRGLGGITKKDGRFGSYDSDSEGLISGRELGRYLKTVVSQESQNLQVPDFGELPGHQCGDFSFYSESSPQYSEAPAQANYSDWCDITPESVDFEFSKQIPVKGKTNQIIFNPIFNNLIAVATNKKLLIWNKDENKFILNVNRGASAISFSPSGRCLVSIDRRGNLLFWNAYTGKRVHSIRVPLKYAVSMVFNPNSSKLALGGKGDILIWNIKANSPETLIEAHGNMIRSLNFIDRKKFMSIGDDLVTKLWNLDLQKEIKSINEKADITKLFAAAFSNDGSIVAVGGKQIIIDLMRNTRTDLEYIRLRNTDTGNDLWTFEGHDAAITSLSFHPNSNFLASGSLDKTIRFWDTRDHKKFKVMNLAKPVEKINFSPDGCFFAAAFDGQVSIWSITNEGG